MHQKLAYYTVFVYIIFMDSVFSDRLQAIERELESALPFPPDYKWKTHSFGELPVALQDKHISPLIIPVRTLMQLGGKRWRPLLLVLTAEAVRANTTKKTETSLSEADTYKITPLVEFVHTASLVHDDIEDSADTRRGQPAAHITYGIDQALNAASWLYFEASCCLKKLNLSPAAEMAYYSLYAQELRRLHLGQAMDISWHRTHEDFPSIEEYFAMVRLKTGTLSSLAAKTGVLAGGGDKEWSELAGTTAAEIGVGFQILDDVKNLTTGNPGKKRGDDIVEGKKSLPVLLHIEKFPEDKKKISELFQAARNEASYANVDGDYHTGDSDNSTSISASHTHTDTSTSTNDAIEKCISLLTESGAVADAKEQGLNLIKQKSEKLAEICMCKKSKSESACLIEKLFAEIGGGNA